MSLLLIDDQGEFWRGDSRQLRVAFDSPYSGGEFVEYAVKNLGFVAINVFGESCQARIRPSFVAEKALQGLIEWLGKTRTQRIVLSTYDSNWRDELFHPRNIATRLDDLLHLKHQAPKNASDFRTQPLAPQVLEASPMLRDIVHAWPHLMSTYDADTLIRLARYALGSRYVVIKRSNPQGELVFQEISDQIYSACETWRSCALGAPIEEQPDRAYGRWVAKSYYDAIGAQTPKLDAVDAIVRNPKHGRSRWRYRRLVFPIQCKSDKPILIGGSIIDHSIDLRICSS